jgi:hypothetical protein
VLDDLRAERAGEYGCEELVVRPHEYLELTGWREVCPKQATELRLCARFRVNGERYREFGHGRSEATIAVRDGFGEQPLPIELWQPGERRGQQALDSRQLAERHRPVSLARGGVLANRRGTMVDKLSSRNGLGKKGPGLHGGPAATQFLCEDHARLRELFRLCQQSLLRSLDLRECECRDLFDALEAHFAVEGQVFYPCVGELLARGGDEVHPGMGLLGQIRDRDGDFQGALKQLRGIELDDPLFGGRLKDLLDLFDLHAREGERELIPLVEELMPIDEMGTLGMRMELRRQSLLKRVA